MAILTRNNETMVVVSLCCSAEIEIDLAETGTHNYVSGALICSKCKQYCTYKKVET